MVYESWQSVCLVSNRSHMESEGQWPSVPQTKAAEILSVLPVGAVRGESSCVCFLPTTPDSCWHAHVLWNVLVCFMFLLRCSICSSSFRLPGQFGAQPQVLPSDFPAQDAFWTVPPSGQYLLSLYGGVAGQIRLRWSAHALPSGLDFTPNHISFTSKPVYLHIQFFLLKLTIYKLFLLSSSK